jgi:hypothetical protein
MYDKYSVHLCDDKGVSHWLGFRRKFDALAFAKAMVRHGCTGVHAENEPGKQPLLIFQQEAPQ